MIKILDESKENLLAARVKGKIGKQDFDVLNPVLEKKVKEH